MTFKRKNYDLEKMKEVYKKLNLRETGQVMGCSADTVKERLNEIGINTHKRKKKDTEKRIRKLKDNPKNRGIYHKNSIKLDNQRLTKLYKQGFNIKELTKEFNISRSTVYYRLKIFNCELEKRKPKFEKPINHQKLLPIDEEKMIQLYNNNSSAEDISKIFKCNLQTIINRLRKRNIKIRPNYVHRNIKPNNPEKILLNIIKENNLPFNYVGAGGIWFKGENHYFNPDFLSTNPKHIIEIFGNYWHNLKKNKEKDEERLKTYSQYGYKTLVIWENELISDKRYRHKLTKEEIVKKITSFLSI